MISSRGGFSLARRPGSSSELSFVKRSSVRVDWYHRGIPDISLFRALGRWAGTALGFIVACPLLALIPAAMLDRGPRGNVRITLFPAALTVLDPFVGNAVRNSLAVAVAASLGSLVVGVGLASLLARWHFWGRRVVSGLVLAPLAVPPAIGALGLRATLGPSGAWKSGWDFVSARTGLDAAWIAWFWVALAAGLPLVVLSASHALAQLEPNWEDAARQVGASRARIWWEITWPAIRTATARATAVVFTLTLAEPGAPIVLGLRRTLGFQLVESVLDVEPAPRSAALALAAIAYSALATALFFWWGRPSRGAPGERLHGQPKRAGALAAACFVAVLGAVAVLAWLPVARLVAAAFAPAPGDSSGRLSHASLVMADLVRDPVIRRWMLNSVTLGACVALLDLLLARTAFAWESRHRKWLRAMVSVPPAIPPLAFGVGALALLQVGALASAVVDTLDGPAILIRALRAVHAILDPYVTPGLLMLLAVTAARRPSLSESVHAGMARYRFVLADAAMNLGAGPARARGLARVGWFGATLGAVLMSATQAATNLAPAIVVGLTIESRTVLPGLVSLADEPGAGFQRAAVLGLGAVFANVAAFVVAACERDGLR